MTVPKREIRIILPLNDDEGESLRDVQVKLQSILSLNFGGFTRTIGQGGWYNDGSVVSEDIAVYDVAVPDNQRTYEFLVGLARMLCIRARQEAVYLRWTTGHVRLVTADVTDNDAADKYSVKLVPPQPEPKGWYHGPTIGQAVDKAVDALQPPEQCPPHAHCSTCKFGDICHPDRSKSTFVEKKNLDPLAQALSALTDHVAAERRKASDAVEPRCPGPPVDCLTCEHKEGCFPKPLRAHRRD